MLSHRLIAGVGVLVCLASASQGQALNGRIDGPLYYSPTGAFKMSIPVLPELGGRVADTENVVTFDDPFNTHIGVACFTLDMTQQWEFDTRGRRDYLTYFFSTFVLPDFEARNPGTRIDQSRYIDTLMGGSLAVFVEIPGGSFFADKNKILDVPGEPERVAKRGNLLFVHEGRIYVISTELAERVTEPSTFKKSAQEENDILQQRLTEIAARIAFLKQPARPTAEKGK